MKKTPTRYSQAYKNDSLALADCISVNAAAQKLDLHSS